MPIQLTGLGGFDSAGLITQLVDVAKKPLQQIDQKKAQVDSATSTMSAFSTRLASLKTAATALSTMSGFSSLTASSTEGGVVPTVTGSALASSFTVNVTQLARAQKTRSDAQGSATTALGQTGDLSIQVGSGSPVTVSVLPTDTLVDVATKISQSGARVSASVVNAGGSFRLVVQGLDTGASNAVTFDELSGLSLGLKTPANTYESAQDAALTVDGLSVTRSTNQIADAIPGVTMALTKVTTSPATVRIAPDTASLKTKIGALVTAFNDVISAGHTAAGYGSIKAQNPVLSADTAVRRSLDRIVSLSTSAISGATGDFRSLAAVGISVSRDRVMSFDSAKLEAALERDPDSVRRLFVTDTASGATGVMKTLSDAIGELVTGSNAVVKSRIDGLAAQSKTLVDSRAKKEERVQEYEQQLRRQFAKLDQAMSRYNSMAGALGSLTNKSGQ